MEICIDGDTIETVDDFHLHALWDVLSASIERPVALTWKRSDKSKQVLGADFDAIIDVLRRVELQDEKFGWTDRFSFVLE